MLNMLFRSRPAPASSTHATPARTRVYAIGDVHGRADLLRRMHELIVFDAQDADVDRKVLVYLGDYVDRGDASNEVIDFILDQYLPGFETVHLTGNHEEMMLAFLEDPTVGPNWMANGGDATLLSYGVGGAKARSADAERFGEMCHALRGNLPQDHLDFLRTLELWHVEGDYMFVHAGIRPGRDPAEQYRTDLIWIRDEFLSSDADHGKCVVHGHTISSKVEFRHNRIGIDTGAFSTGKLTCLVLEGLDQRLLHT